MRNQRKKRTGRYAFLFPAFIGLGAGLGALLHNVGLGTATGAAVGATLSWVGSLFEERPD